MTRKPHPQNTARRFRHVGSLTLALLAGGTLGGCEMDSWFDPSKVGRWEHTPTSVPILERLSVIETGTSQFVEYSEVTAEDLEPYATDYRFGPGDILDVVVWDLPVRDIATPYPQRRVDSMGSIEVPQLGMIRIAGLTLEEARDAIAERMREYVGDPLVAITPVSQRQLMITLSGGVVQPGPYAVPSPDYRLLEALTAAGGFDENTPYVYVYRTESREPAPTHPPTQPTEAPGTVPNPAPEDDANVADVIDDILGDMEEQRDTSDDEKIEPAFFPLPAVLRSGWASAPATAPVFETARARIEEPTVSDKTPAPIAEPSTRWVFQDGRWVRRLETPTDSSDPGLGEAPDMLGGTEELAGPKQRVIAIPTKPLVQGDPKYNIVVHPRDVIRVPRAEAGNVYLGGEVSRPGVYQLPAVGRLTLKQALIAAGGLSTIAIPERVDLTRRVAADREATIRLDLRAIAEGTQPDIFIKPDDTINVGTNFWAYPLAVVRNGIRASYGYGFILDRNFGNDVFGPPPIRRVP